MCLAKQGGVASRYRNEEWKRNEEQYPRKTELGEDEQQAENLSYCEPCPLGLHLHVAEPLCKQALHSQRTGKWEFTTALLYKVSGLASMECILQIVFTHRHLMIPLLCISVVEWHNCVAPSIDLTQEVLTGSEKQVSFLPRLVS